MRDIRGADPRFTTTCPECCGRGMRDHAVLPDVPARVADVPDVPVADSATFRKVTKPCETCRGAGSVRRTERVPVIQDGRQVGSVPPSFDPTAIRSTNWLYDPRPGDFRREGDTWIASRTLGPGDLEAVPGFVWDRQQRKRPA